MLSIMNKLLFHHKKIITGLLLVTLLSSSCKQLIEIPPNPPTQITETQQFADSATAMTAVAGVYSYPANGNYSFRFNDGYLTLYGSLSSDELSTSGNGGTDDLQFFENNVTPFNSTLNTVWSDPYAGLYPVNAVLNNLTNSNNLSASFKKEITAEMKVVRSLYYFYLINLFGDVPYVASTDYKQTALIPRTPVDTVYNHILTDLTDAQQVLAADYPSSGRVRPNLYTVDAFLSKVHLYRKEWQKAYDAATVVIGSGIYNLEPDLNNVFLDGSQEAIWQLPATSVPGNSVTRDASNFIPYSSGSAPNYLITTSLLNAFESGDQRLTNWTTQIVVSGQPLYYPYKYKNRTAPSPTTEDYMIFRLGELYLIRAEAAAELDNTAVALADLNAVRARAGLTPSAAVTQNDILAAIMHERQTELFCEWGNRWLDLKRTGTIDAVLGAEKPGWQPTDALYPVPNPQILVDNLLKQNPGYN